MNGDTRFEGIEISILEILNVKCLLRIQMRIEIWQSDEQSRDSGHVLR